MYLAILGLPLLAAMLAGFGRGWLGDRGAQLVTCAGVIIAALIGAVAFADVVIGQQPRTIEIVRWILSGSFVVNWAMKLDTLSCLMILVVTVVSSCVHVYSIGYMAHDPSKPRFMAYLSLFTFFMLMLVTADNFIQIYFGWEGVGLASYLLIGFWYDRPSANAAAIKAFVVNRVGDFGFALGIMAIFLTFDSVSFDTVFAAAPGKIDVVFDFCGYTVPAISCACLLLLLGAMGKSAQAPLHTWLPDAMEGPTPVSALIHAATMVTAGVFLVCRLSPLFELSDAARAVVTTVGATTAIFAATVAITQTDIKRVIAYSTCSQLGYMFFAAGVSAYGAAMFHLMTHAFFKALLFLCAGSVIHALSDEQDLRKMGGLRRFVPVTYWLMLIGNLALSGIWPFAGYFSKDTIIEAARAAGNGVGAYAYWVGIIVAGLTAFYSFRQFFLTFHGPSRADRHALAHAHESPQIMLAPLYLLAAGAIVAGFIGVDYFVGADRAAFWGASIVVHADHDTIARADAAARGPLDFLPIAMGGGGILVAYLMYVARPALAPALARNLRPLYLFSLHKWYFDELYDALFVRPALALGRIFWQGGDVAIIDRLGPNGVALVTRILSRRAGALQSGYLYHYAFAILIGVVAFATYFTTRAR